MKNFTQALYKIRVFLLIIHIAGNQCPALLCIGRVFQGLSFEAHVSFSETLITFKIQILS